MQQPTGRRATLESSGTWTSVVSCRAICKDSSPHALVNCHTSAALLELESEASESPEKDARSREVLAFLTSLATACEASQIFLLHLSSDAVFGTRQQTQQAQPQSVDAEPQPCTPLGWRTLAAEQEVLSRRASAVLRLPLWDGPAGPAQSLEEFASRASPQPPQPAHLRS